MSDTLTSPPDDANEECVGPDSSKAGTASSCAGCPNASACASNAANPKATSISSTPSTLTQHTAHTILVLSGKGGVGKSTVATQLAYTLSSRGYHVGLLDVDICGPSAPRMLGVSGRVVHQSASGWSPVYVTPNLCVMSIGFLLPDEDSAVVWRGPRKNGLIKQFLNDTDWGNSNGEKLDYVIVDTPPGTSDEHISTVQLLQEGNSSISGAIVVTTPEEVSMADVRKELNFCKKTNVKVLGVVENMSEFRTTLSKLTFWRPTDNINQQQHEEDCTDYVMTLLQEKCPELLHMTASTHIFPPSGLGPKGMAESFHVPYLGKIPLDSNLLKCCEDGKCFVECYEDGESPAVQPMNELADRIIRDLPIEEEEEEEEK